MAPDRLDMAKRIMGYRTDECPPEIEKWILARLHEMSFWDMIAASRAFRVRM